jgi:hypothetical protein
MLNKCRRFHCNKTKRLPLSVLFSSHILISWPDKMQQKVPKHLCRQRHCSEVCNSWGFGQCHFRGLRKFEKNEEISGFNWPLMTFVFTLKCNCLSRVSKKRLIWFKVGNYKENLQTFSHSFVPNLKFKWLNHWKCNIDSFSNIWNKGIFCVQKWLVNFFTNYQKIIGFSEIWKYIFIKKYSKFVNLEAKLKVLTSLFIVWT